MASIGTIKRSVTLRRWVWFMALWCGGVGAAVLLGEAFKLFMNATLFAVTT
jgi:hypothetical protein